MLKVGDVEVKLRHNSPSATVHQRASNRISALSNQLISQWQQNSPGSVTTPVKRQVNVSVTSVLFCDVIKILSDDLY